MSSEDIEYYRQRAVDERALALKADRQEIAAIHEELARQYQALVDQAELRVPANSSLPRSERARYQTTP